MGQNVFPVGESAGLFGESTSFGIDMALESSAIAAGFIEKQITGDAEYEKYQTALNLSKADEEEVSKLISKVGFAYGFSKFHKHWVKPQPQIMRNLFPQAFFGVIRFAGITKPDSV